MNDKELLELAAKAAGMHKLTEWSDGICDHDSPHYGYPALHEAGPGGACGSWNPLTDDGDALRLGVRLGLMVDLFECANDSVEASFDDGDFSAYCTEPVGEDKAAATRRAIVRVAAEIGKAME